MSDGYAGGKGRKGKGENPTSTGLTVSPRPSAPVARQRRELTVGNSMWPLEYSYSPFMKLYTPFYFRQRDIMETEV